MTSHRASRTPLCLLIALTLATPAAAQRRQRPAPQAVVSWDAADRAFGRAGQAQPGGVMKYAFPRSDLRVTVGDVAVRPALALGSWVAMAPIGGGRVMAMGDLVLTADELSAVVSRLQEGQVEQTAIHNHLLGEEPRVMYVHIRAHGDPAAIAETIRAALAMSKTPLQAAQQAAQAAQAVVDSPAPSSLDTAAIAHALGRAGKLTGGVYQVSVPRAEAVRDGGHVVPPSMGVATAINFQPTGEGRAAVTGDFVMTAAEVNPVIRALRAANIQVTALHSHMIDESPRLLFMHFWANDDALTLARGLRSALDRMHVP